MGSRDEPVTAGFVMSSLRSSVAAGSDFHPGELKIGGSSEAEH